MYSRRVARAASSSLRRGMREAEQSRRRLAREQRYASSRPVM